MSQMSRAEVEATLNQFGADEILEKILGSGISRLALPGNLEVSRTLFHMRQVGAAAKDKPGLLAAVDLATSLGRPLEYRHGLYQGLIGLGCAALITIGLSYLVTTFAADSPGQNLHEWLLIVGGVSCAVLTAIPLLLMLGERGLLALVSRRLYERSVEIDNGFTVRRVDSEQLADTYAAEFREFRRGNHSHKVMATATVPLVIGGAPVICEYYQQKYVDRHLEAKGETRDDLYVRYGLIVPFPYCSDLSVGRGAGLRAGVAWKTESAPFNAAFAVTGRSQLEAARFMKPAVILAFMSAAETFDDLCVEVGDQGRLCLSFRNPDLLEVPNEAGLDDPQHIMRRLAQTLRPPRLAAANQLLDALARHSSHGLQEAA